MKIVVLLLSCFTIAFAGSKEECEVSDTALLELANLKQLLAELTTLVELIIGGSIPPVNEPFIITDVDIEISWKEVTLTWTPPEGVIGYKAILKTSSGDGSLVGVSPKATSFSTTDIVLGTNYTVEITPIKKDGPGDKYTSRVFIPECPSVCTFEYNPVCGTNGITYSNPCTLDIAQCNSGPDVDIALAGEGICEPFIITNVDIEIRWNEVTLTWTPPEGVIGYTATLRSSSGDKTLVRLSPYDTSFSTTDIVVGTNYTIQITPIKADGPGESYTSEAFIPDCIFVCTREYAPVCGTNGITYSNPCTLEVAQCNSGPDADIDVAGEGICEPFIITDVEIEISWKEVTLTWTPPEGVIGYTAKLTSSSGDGSLIRLSPYDTSFSTTDIIVGTNYTVKITPIKADGPGEPYTSEAFIPECPAICTLIFAPVCGTDEVTYSNPCLLEVANCLNSDTDIAIAREGQCDPCEFIQCDVPKCLGIYILEDIPAAGECCVGCIDPCLDVLCVEPICVGGLVISETVAEGECCIGCVDPCLGIACAAPICEGGLVAAKSVEEGECCIGCVDPCFGIVCDPLVCEGGLVAAETVAEGECCIVCVDPCLGIVCDVPVCEGGLVAADTVAEGECCFGCVDPCLGVVCAAPICEDGLVAAETVAEGECCIGCVDPCLDIVCDAPICGDGFIAAETVAEGECCIACVDPCLGIVCDVPVCEGGLVAAETAAEGECCVGCVDPCLGVACAAPICGDGLVAAEAVAEGECCIGCVDPCLGIVCDAPICGDGLVAAEIVAEGECCIGCVDPCLGIVCDAPVCEGGLVNAETVSEGECCIGCVDPCLDIVCDAPICENGLVAAETVEEGECCIGCVDPCLGIACDDPICEGTLVAAETVEEGECCLGCVDACLGIVCDEPICEFGLVIGETIEEGECCLGCVDPCVGIECGELICEGGLVVADVVIEGECCVRCVDPCLGISCDILLICEMGLVIAESVAEGECCVKCIDPCADIQCDIPHCSLAFVAAETLSEGECCVGCVPIVFSDCSDVQDSGITESGTYMVQAAGSTTPFEIYCDLVTDGGKWNVILRRDGTGGNFYRDYADYVTGFGDVAGSYWLGLENFYQLNHQGDTQLRVDMTDFSGNSDYSQYSHFVLNSADTEYTIQASSMFSGGGGNALYFNKGYRFSARDRDNDGNQRACAEELVGGWWYRGNMCSRCNLLGEYLEYEDFETDRGIFWAPFKGRKYSLNFVELKIRNAK